MSCYYRKERQCWWYDFLVDGKRYRGVCLDPIDKVSNAKTKRDAVQYEANLKLEIRKRGKKPRDNYTFVEACLDYLEYEGQNLRSFKDIKQRIEYLISYFGKYTLLSEIRKEEVDILKRHLQKKKKPVFIKPKNGDGYFKETDKTISNSTVNQYLADLSRVMTYAVDNTKLSTRPKIKLLSVDNDLPNPVTVEHAKAILENSAPHLHLVIMLATYTGMRLQEILTLEPHKVDINNMFIKLDSQTKAKRGRIVYFNEEVKNILLPLMKQKFIVEYGSKPIKSITTAWKAAIKRAKVPDYKFHNLRATFCSLVASQPGASMLTVKDMAGHVSASTTLRYMKSFDSQLKDTASKIKL